MEKTRVPKGKKYWYINDVLLILECIETDSPIDKSRFEAGNYFHSPHKLSDMSFKLEKVLKGAEVLEMPSEEEFYEFAPSTNKLGGFSLENRRQVRGFQDCWDWIKSKIIK